MRSGRSSRPRGAPLRTNSAWLLGVVAALGGCGEKASPEELALRGCKARYDNLHRWMQVRGRSPETDTEIKDAIRATDKDPWGNAYTVEREGGAGFVIWSSGPDGIEGNDDDINYPPGD